MKKNLWTVLIGTLLVVSSCESEDFTSQAQEPRSYSSTKNQVEEELAFTYELAGDPRKDYAVKLVLYREGSFRFDDGDNEDIILTGDSSNPITLPEKIRPCDVYGDPSNIKEIIQNKKDDFFSWEISNISHCTELIRLQATWDGSKPYDFANNPKLVDLQLASSNLNNLVNIDKLNNLKMLYLYASSNSIKNLRITNPNLNTVGINMSMLQSLDITNNKNLYSLNVASTSLKSLNIANNTGLEYLHISAPVEYLNLSGVTQLTAVNIRSLKCNIDLSKNRNLYSVISHNNQFLENKTSAISFANNLPNSTRNSVLDIWMLNSEKSKFKSSWIEKICISKGWTIKVNKI